MPRTIICICNTAVQHILEFQIKNYNRSFRSRDYSPVFLFCSPQTCDFQLAVTLLTFWITYCMPSSIWSGLHAFISFSSPLRKWATFFTLPFLSICKFQTALPWWPTKTFHLDSQSSGAMYSYVSVPSIPLNVDLNPLNLFYNLLIVHHSQFLRKHCLKWQFQSTLYNLSHLVTVSFRTCYSPEMTFSFSFSSFMKDSVL